MLHWVAKVAYTRCNWQLFVVVVGGTAKWWIFWTWKTRWICRYKYHLRKSVIKLKRMENYKKVCKADKETAEFFSVIAVLHRAPRSDEVDYFTSRQNCHNLSKAFGRKLVNKLFSFTFKPKHRTCILGMAPRRPHERWQVAKQLEETHSHESIWDNVVVTGQRYLPCRRDSRKTVCSSSPVASHTVNVRVRSSYVGGYIH